MYISLVIGGLFITIISFTMAENEKLNTQYYSQSQECDYKLNLSLDKTLLYKNNILFFGEDSLKNPKVIAFDIIDRIINNTLSANLSLNLPKDIQIENDILYGYDNESSKYKYENDVWTKTNLIDYRGRINFVKKYDSSRNTRLFEDENYCVVRIYCGEWDSVIVFIDKSTNKYYAKHIVYPISVYKDEKSYYISSCNDFYGKSVEILRIPEPNKLLELKDTTFQYGSGLVQYILKNYEPNYTSEQKNRMILLSDSVKICRDSIWSLYEERRMYKLEYSDTLEFPYDAGISAKHFLPHKKEYMKIIRKLANKEEKLRINMYEESSFDSNALSLFRSYPLSEYRDWIGTATFDFDGKKLHCLGDSTLYLCEIKNHKIKKYKTLFDQTNNFSHLSLSIYDKNKLLSVYQYRRNKHELYCFIFFDNVTEKFVFEYR